MFLVVQILPGESSWMKSNTESSTQTDIHPVETNIHKSYEWNEWELRRKALKLVSYINLCDVFFYLHDMVCECLASNTSSENDDYEKELRNLFK